MSGMVDNPEIYFSKQVPDRDSLLIKLEEEAQNENIPIVGPVVGQFLFLLARMTRAKRILELGTATGYSAIFLARACKIYDGKVVTLENDQDMAARAQQNFQKAGLEKHVEIRFGDAMAELARAKDKYDFIFMDNTTYDQLTFQQETIGEPACFLKEGMDVDVLLFRGNPINVQLPVAVKLTITHTEPGVRGDTATNVTKPATLETGAEIKVPLFINQGDVVKIDTRSGEYLERTTLD